MQDTQYSAVGRSSIRFKTDAAMLLGYVDVLVKQGNKKGAGLRLMDARLFVHEAADVDDDIRSAVAMQIDQMSRKIRDMKHTFSPIG